MEEFNFTASKLFCSANRFIEAYHTVLQPLCKETGLPPTIPKVRPQKIFVNAADLNPELFRSILNGL